MKNPFKKGFYIGNICYFTLSVKEIYKTFPIFVIFCFNVEKNLNKLDELDLSDEMRVVFFSPSDEKTCRREEDMIYIHRMREILNY